MKSVELGYNFVKAYRQTKMNCPKCHQETNPGSQFCGNCGASLVEQAPQPIVAPQTIGASSPQPQVVNPALPNDNDQTGVIGSAPVSAPSPTTTSGASPLSAPQVIQTPMNPSPVTDTTPQLNSTLALPEDELDKNSGKAVAAFVLGLLSIVGALMPLIGVPMAIVAIVLGAFGKNSRHKTLAIIGIVAAIVSFPLSGASGYYGYKQALKNEEAKNTPAEVVLKDIVSDCYTAKLPEAFVVTQGSDNNCNLQAEITGVDSDGYYVSVENEPRVNSTNLMSGVRQEIQIVLASLPGAKITSEKSTLFKGEPAYSYTIETVDGKKMIVLYTIHSTVRGNLVSMARATTKKVDSMDLEVLSNNFEWK